MADQQSKTVTKWRYVWKILGLMLLAGLGLVGLAIVGFYQATKTEFWNRDGPPSAEVRQRLDEWRYPASITRVVEIGCSSNFNGDGESLTIYCFPPKDVALMKASLGHDGVWLAGLPEGSWWRGQLAKPLPSNLATVVCTSSDPTMERRAPSDLAIDREAPPQTHIHIPCSPGSFRCTVIDVVRGISYELVFRS